MTLAGDAVRELLRRTGLTKSELSRRSGVSRALIDDYLKGRRQPSVAQVERLGKVADLRVDIVWSAPGEVEADAGESWTESRTDRTPRWARANPDMRPSPLTIEERAQVMERVIPVAMATRRHPRDELEFPPFRALLASRDRVSS